MHQPARQLFMGFSTAWKTQYTGLILGLMVIAAWGSVHALALFALPLAGGWWLLVPPLLLLQCWLFVGLFIIAHDCMHGSLAPGLPGLNRAVGSLCLFLYAGFAWEALRQAHYSHHRHSGTAADPDFHPDHPRRFLPWFRRFMLHYSSWRQPAYFGGLMLACMLVAGISPGRVLLFVALPALASSMQLFYFGTYLPHRHDNTGFIDGHNARSSGYSRLISLVTCFHFGYHHTHHLHPHVPWWRLPAAQANDHR